ncbi:MAG: flagellar motor protein MotB [Phycisphaerae bacterium]|nr:flagellar motor protein MotB [Phycisphaerae bacterium]
MKKKCKCPVGVPEWVVTYGDMMTLLLCFFILLAAFSELKKDQEFQDVVKAIQEAFGYTGGAGVSPTQDAPAKSIINRIEAIALHKSKFRKPSRADDPGVTGKQTTVKRIREGLLFSVGGLVSFEPGSAELLDHARGELAKIARLVRGQNNKIEVRGHATALDLEALGAEATGAARSQLWELSHRRALAAMEALTSTDNGIRPQRIRVVACASHEPLLARAYDQDRAAANRRVEIIVNESLVQDHADEGPAPAVSFVPE